MVSNCPLKINNYYFSIAGITPVEAIPKTENFLMDVFDEDDRVDLRFDEESPIDTANLGSSPLYITSKRLQPVPLPHPLRRRRRILPFLLLPLLLLPLELMDTNWCLYCETKIVSHLHSFLPPGASHHEVSVRRVNSLTVVASARPWMIQTQSPNPTTRSRELTTTAFVLGLLRFPPMLNVNLATKTRTIRFPSDLHPPASSNLNPREHQSSSSLTKSRSLPRFAPPPSNHPAPNLPHFRSTHLRGPSHGF